MIAFLASHIGGSYKKSGKRFPTFLNSDNDFVARLKQRWVPNCTVLLISADPHTHERNDSILECLSAAFPMSGLPISGMALCDSRSEEVIERMADFPVIILSGGHVPTQNRYFKKLKLKEKLESYDGIVIGISAGTMNSAQIVYAHPEAEGEAIDPQYRRFLPGLGITHAMVLPHYQAIREDVLDGFRVMEDIAYPDSRDKTFYALVDGSYLVAENGITTLFGEAYRILDGEISLFCAKNESRVIP